MTTSKKIYSLLNRPKGSTLQFGNKDLTQQQFKNDADINEIVRRAKKTGSLIDPSIKVGRVPQFGDFSGVVDYHTAQNQLIEAKNAFMQLDPYVRQRFRNDPHELIEFLSDDKNRDEAEKLGLVSRKMPLPSEVKGGSSEPPKAS